MGHSSDITQISVSKRLLILFSISFFIFGSLNSDFVSAGKLYKIIDKNGKVTYSQFPPKEKEEDTKVEGLKVSNDHDVASKIERVGERLYCGDIYLGYDKDRARYRNSKNREEAARELQRKIENWETRKKKQQQQLEKSAQSQFKSNAANYSRYSSDSHKNQRHLRWQEQREQAVKRIKNYNCAVAWARSRLAEPTDDNADNDEEIARLNNLIEKHLKTLVANCGEEPVFDPTTAHGKQKTETWEKCAASYRTDIRKMERRIRTLSSAY